MRNLAITCALLAVFAGAVGVAVYHGKCDPAMHALARDGDTLRWIRTEFRLTDTQYEAVLRLHADHSQACAGHCAAVRAARERLAALAARAASAAEMAAAGTAVGQAEEHCRAAVEAHVRRVAALMEPAQGQRYLEMVLPRLSRLEHAGPADLRLNP